MFAVVRNLLDTWSNISVLMVQVPLGDSERRLQVPPLIDKAFTLEGRGWKESVADVILSSIGK